MDIETICGVCWFTFLSRCSARCQWLLSCFLLLSIIHRFYGCHDGGIIREHSQKTTTHIISGATASQKAPSPSSCKAQKEKTWRPLLPHCHWLPRPPSSTSTLSTLEQDVGDVQIPVTGGKGRPLEEEILAATTWPCNSGVSSLTSVGLAWQDTGEEK